MKRGLLFSLLTIFFFTMANAADPETIVINLNTIEEGIYVGYEVKFDCIDITANGNYEVIGTTERVGKETRESQKNIRISEDLAVNLTFRDVSIINESVDCLSIYSHAFVNLTIEGTNRLYSRDGTGIGISSGKLNIQSSGADALLICEGWSQGIGSGAGELTIEGGNIISYGKSTGMTLPYSTFTVNSGVFIGVSIDDHIVGIDAQIIRLDLQEAATVDTQLTLYQDKLKVATFTLPAGYKKIDVSGTGTTTFSLKASEIEMGSGFTAGNLYTVSLKGTGIGSQKVSEDRIYVNGKDIVIETLTTRSMTIYSIDGQIVRVIDLQKGINQINNLNGGTYMVNGQKVVVM